MYTIHGVQRACYMCTCVFTLHKCVHACACLYIVRMWMGVHGTYVCMSGTSVLFLRGTRKAFRSLEGKSQLCLLLPTGVPFVALTATATSYVR